MIDETMDYQDEDINLDIVSKEATQTEVMLPKNFNLNEESTAIIEQEYIPSIL